MTSHERPLKPRQARFAIEYGFDHNGRQAAIRAGYKADRAADIAWRLLKDERVKRIIHDALQCRLNDLEFKINQVGKIQSARAMSSIGDLMTVESDGVIRFKRVSELRDSQLRDVEELITGADGQTTGVRVRNPTDVVLELMNLAEFVTGERS